MGLKRISKQLLALFSIENLGKYWQYCQLYGFSSATRLALRRIRKPKGAPPAYPALLNSFPAARPEIAPVEKTVSVIIPTLNAGNNIQHLLRLLNEQEGIRKCEVIVVDSGSTDDTVVTAENEGALVSRIEPHQFTHAFARNKGAETAQGDYLLFMVQDALPLTRRWIYEMLSFMETHGVAAVSCAEFPRADSDLFYQFLIDSQSNDLGLSFDRVAGWDDSCASVLGLRANAHLSDIAALIRSDIFARYRYRAGYAEDLDLGVRLIRDGHKLGFLCSTKVLHSHNRTPYYFLKRGYADVRFLTDVLPNFVYPEIEDKARLYRDIIRLQARVGGLGTIVEQQTFPVRTSTLADLFRSKLENGGIVTGDVPDLQFRQLLALLAGDSGLQDHKLEGRSIIWPHARRHLENLKNWLSKIYVEVDGALAAEMADTFAKVVALHCGTHLGYLFLSRAAHSELDESLWQLDSQLRAGI